MLQEYSSGKDAYDALRKIDGKNEISSFVQFRHYDNYNLDLSSKSAAIKSLGTIKLFLNQLRLSNKRKTIPMKIVQ